MDPHDTPTQQDKQITIDVPADRVAEFYAFYGHFLAGGRGRRGGRGRGLHGHGPGRGRCGHHGHPHHEEHGAEDQPAGSPAS